MLVRAATIADGAVCAAIYEPSVVSTGVSFETEAPDADEMARRIEAAGLTHPWLVAEQDGVVVGFAYGSRHRERAAYRWAADVAVYVSAPLHGQSIGRLLLDQLLVELEARGYRIACAAISLPNDASVALHRVAGFEQIGVERAIGWKLGAWRDVSLWQRRLGEVDDGEPAEPGA